MAGGARLDSGTGVLLSTKETRDVLGRLGGRGTALPRRSGGGDKNGDGEDETTPQLRMQGQGPQGGAKGPGKQRRKW